jgi:hypothetical protein
VGGREGCINHLPCQESEDIFVCSTGRKPWEAIFFLFLQWVFCYKAFHFVSIFEEKGYGVFKLIIKPQAVEP